MHASRWITTVDTHTEGEPTRIVTGGIAHLAGSSLTEKLSYFRHHMDHLRTALVAEPRGHKDMYGCVLTQPVAPDAAWGVLFMDNGGYMSMCGHATVGVSTALVELGMVQVEEPRTRFRLETPAGLVESIVSVKEGRAECVSFRNVPAYAECLDVSLTVPGVGDYLTLADTLPTICATWPMSSRSPSPMRAPTSAIRTSSRTCCSVWKNP